MLLYTLSDPLYHHTSTLVFLNWVELGTLFGHLSGRLLAKQTGSTSIPGGTQAEPIGILDITFVNSDESAEIPANTHENA